MPASQFAAVRGKIQLALRINWRMPQHSRKHSTAFLQVEPPRLNSCEKRPRRASPLRQAARPAFPESVDRSERQWKFYAFGSIRNAKVTGKDSGDSRWPGARPNPGVPPRALHLRSLAVAVPSRLLSARSAPPTIVAFNLILMALPVAGGPGIPSIELTGPVVIRRCPAENREGFRRIGYAVPAGKRVPLPAQRFDAERSPGIHRTAQRDGRRGNRRGPAAGVADKRLRQLPDRGVRLSSRIEEKSLSNADETARAQSSAATT